MKLKNYLAMMAIALCAVACSDDDNKKEDTVIPAQEVAGTYNGTLSLSVSGNDQGTSDSQVKITEYHPFVPRHTSIYYTRRTIPTISRIYNS